MRGRDRAREGLQSWMEGLNEDDREGASKGGRGVG